MKIKVYALGKMVIIGTIVAILFTVVIDVLCAVYALISDIGNGENSAIIFAILLFGALLMVGFVFILYKKGIFTSFYITDEGIIHKKKQVNWDEIKVTGYMLNEKNPKYYLLFDIEYQYGKQNLIQKQASNAYMTLNDFHLERVVPIILNYLKSNIIFLNADGSSKIDMTELPMYISNAFQENICNIDTDFQ